MRHPRRLFLAAAGALLAGCGFQLRQPPSFAFSTIQVFAGQNSLLADELRRNLGSAGTVRVVQPRSGDPVPDVVLEMLSEQRQKVVVGVNAAGQVREFQLRSLVRFRLSTPRGRELIPATELLQQRDISFNESAVLAKETEEALLFRDMQGDLVQQLMRRLGAVKAL